MMARTQIALEYEMQRRARQRASELGLSLAAYLRSLLANDLACPSTDADVSCVFDLGSSLNSDIARHKDAMLAEAFVALHEPLEVR
jgi:hypothetical protein